MKIPRNRNVHACLFLLPLVKAAWLRLASVIMVSKDTSSNTEHLQDRICRSEQSTFHLLQSPISATIPMVSHSWATRSHSYGDAAGGTAGARRAARPTHWGWRRETYPPPASAACSEAAMKNFTTKAQSGLKTAPVCAQVKSEYSIQSRLSTSVMRIKPRFVMISRYHRLPIAYRKHWQSEPSFESLNPSAELGTSIDSYSREEKEQVSNQVSVPNNEKKKK